MTGGGPSLADALVDALADWGVRYVFGVSGANIEHLHDAVFRRGADRLSAVLAKREDSAAYMADAHARAQRTIGVCCATSGGGMMNLVSGLGESLADGIPVLAVIGQSPAAFDGMGAFQEATGRPGTVDAVGLLRSVTRYTARITEPASLWPHLRAALAAMLTGRRGPAALLIPRDLFDAEVGPRPYDWPADLGTLDATPQPDVAELQALLRALRDATRPVIVLGPEVRAGADPDAVTEFARRTGIPVAATMQARGDFPNADPRYLGVVGSAGHPSVHALLRDEADLIVAAGTDLNLPVRAPLGDLKPDRIAVLCRDPSMARAALHPRYALCCDPGPAFRRLCELVDERPLRAPGHPRYRLRRYSPQLTPDAPVPPALPHGDGDTLLTSEAIAAIRPYLPEHGRVLTDAGNCGAAVMHLAELPVETTAIVAFGMGGMGYTLGGAIGAQLGAARGRTVAFLGDGSFLMSGMEIHTAAELQLPVLYVVFNNQMHGMCVSRQLMFFDARLTCAQYGPVDVAAVSRGLAPADRLWVGSAGSAAELDRLLADYHRDFADRPGVLELRLAREEIPPMTPFVTPDAPTHVVTDSGVRRAG